MLYRQLFLDAISAALADLDYHLVGSDFYIYKRDIGIVVKFGFDVITGGSDFYIFGCTAAFSDPIKLRPDGQLYVYGSDVSEYASRCGAQAFSNLNIDPNTNTPRRYTKALIANRIRYNMELFSKYLLADILRIEDLEDYYGFKVRSDGFGYYIPIPFPTISAFYLCFMLGKLREASHVYIMMLRRRDEDVRVIDRDMRLERKSMITDALEAIDIPSRSGSAIFEQLDREAAIVEAFLKERSDDLDSALQKRIAASRAICDSFFTG